MGKRYSKITFTFQTEDESLADCRLHSSVVTDFHKLAGEVMLRKGVGAASIDSRCFSPIENLLNDDSEAAG